MADHTAAHAGRLPIEAVKLAEADVTFARFYEACFPRIYAFVRAQVGSAQAAQEIVGRVFLKAIRHREKIPAGGDAVVWVFRIAHNTLIDYWRVDGRRESRSVSLDEVAEIPADLIDPEARYLTRERQVLLLRVIATLDQGDRVVLALKFAGQRTNREIAAVLGMREGAVSMRLLRALRRLRERLVELGAS